MLVGMDAHVGQDPWDSLATWEGRSEEAARTAATRFVMGVVVAIAFPLGRSRARELSVIVAKSEVWGGY